MVGAGATRSAVHNYTPGPQRVSLGGFRRVLYPIFHCYPVFKASSPCLSAEPAASTSLRRLKRPPCGGPGERSQSVRRSNLCAPLSFQVVPRHQLEKYSTSPRGVKLVCGVFQRARRAYLRLPTWSTWPSISVLESESLSSCTTLPPTLTAPPFIKRRASPFVLAKPASVIRSTIQISSSGNWITGASSGTSRRTTASKSFSAPAAADSP